MSHLIDAQATCRALESRVTATSRRTVERMIEKKLNSPLTSSCGRLFDAVASLIGIRDIATYEGQAAMQLEWAAKGCDGDGAYPFEISSSEDSAADKAFVVDSRPMIRAIAADVDSNIQAAVIARRFHSTLVEIIVAVCAAIAKATGISQVVLSGGVFMNTLLTDQTISRLREEGYSVYRQEKVPPNDGGLSLGQLAVAASVDRAGES
jgi:hydrogenase maturation protein HypF